MEENNSTALSVVIPVYNAERTIRKALDSLLGQSLKEIEVICVDDGSADASVQIISEYAGKDSRVRLLRQQNLYAGIARNNGMDAAQGAYLFFLDADDYVMNYALEAAYDKCVKYDLDCLRFRSFTLDEGSNRLIRNARNDFSHLDDGDYNRLLTLEEDSPLLKISVAPWSGMYRRAFLAAHGCRFNGLRCVNDRSFFNRVITAGGRYMCARDRVTVHRVNQSDSLIGRKADHFDCQIESLRITEAQLRDSGADRKTAELIMRQEYRDLTVWYRKYAADPERRKEMDRKIREYAEEDDTAFSGLLREAQAEAEQENSLPAEPGEDLSMREACDKPLVSVTVPVMNAEDSLNRTLECLANQRLEKMEFILEDLGSTDHSLTIMKEYAEADRRFRTVGKGGADPKGKITDVLAEGIYPDPDYYERMYLQAAGPAIRILHKAVSCVRLIREQGIGGLREYVTEKKK